MNLPSRIFLSSVFGVETLVVPVNSDPKSVSSSHFLLFLICVLLFPTFPLLFHILPFFPILVFLLIYYVIIFFFSIFLLAYLLFPFVFTFSLSLRSRLFPSSPFSITFLSTFPPSLPSFSLFLNLLLLLSHFCSPFLPSFSWLPLAFIYFSFVLACMLVLFVLSFLFLFFHFLFLFLYFL